MARPDPRTSKLIDKGNACLQGNDLDNAIRHFKEACRIDPGNIQAWHMLSAVYGMSGQFDLAESSCRRALEIQPGAHNIQINLANALALQGKSNEAIRIFQGLLAQKPDDADVLSSLGNIFLQIHHFEEAIPCYESSLKADPSRAETWNNMGMALRAQDRATEAVSCCKQALALNPAYGDAYCNLGSLLVDQMKIDEAEANYLKALQYQPDSAAIHCNMGKLLQTKGQLEEAMKSYQRALQISPNDPESIAAAAGLHERMGQIDMARELLRPLVTPAASSAAAALNFASTARETGDRNTSISILTKLLKNRLPRNDKADIHFALGDLYDKCGSYDDAFEHYHAGNLLDSHKVNNDSYQNVLDQLTTSFSSESVEHLPRSSNLSDVPVFIVGMPRSGTTLVEQILASHHAVFGGGELSSISILTESLQETTGNKNPYPACVQQLDRKTVNRIADSYISELASLDRDALRITDKTPLHFMDLGFIDLLLPNTRIIHCKRDPLDTCLSIYFHRFNKYHAYACDLSSLGIFYRYYEKLMRHWQSVLRIPVMEVQYEELVSNQESVSRNIINFCDLPWDERCLRFYENKRIADTPSYNQVRRAIYTGSVGRWKHYSGHIAALRDALDSNI